MGKQNNLKFIGTVNNLVYYKWKDVYAVRIKPPKVNQTKASIEQSKLFGMAAHAGAVLRNALKSALPDPKDLAMMRRFEQTIVQWLRRGDYTKPEPQNNLPFITSFEFNEDSLLQERFKLRATVNNTEHSTIAVLIPAVQPIRDIRAPAQTKSITLKLRAAACSLLNDNSLLCTAKEIALVYNDFVLPAQEIELPLAVEAGNITVVMMAIEYTAIKNGITYMVKDKRWMPAGVLGALWRGEIK